jgi:hypothetical protein
MAPCGVPQAYQETVEVGRVPRNRVHSGPFWAPGKQMKGLSDELKGADELSALAVEIEANFEDEEFKRGPALVE